MKQLDHHPWFTWRRDGLAVLALALAVLAVYGQSHSFKFLHYDDPEYIYSNPQVTSGLTWANVAWAFTARLSANWHPLTWLSHMTDWELFGNWAGGHHLMSVSLHTLTAALLYLLLVRLTGWRWPSLLVAGLFALHPLHVESVAWASERKDVLSALLMMLTLWAYVRYTERRNVRRYAAVLALLALGLMAKPMLVTVPFVLLLLDYWPLGRTTFGGGASRAAQPPPQPAAQPAAPLSSRAKSRPRSPQPPPPARPRPPEALSLWWLLLEKLPLFALVFSSSVVTYFVQRAGGAMAAVPLSTRVANAAGSYVLYLWHMIWPVGLAPFYPYHDDQAAWRIGGALALLAAVTVLVFVMRRSRPYLIVGWLWYLGTLVPVIGLVQVGMQAMADRYTYIPLIGIFIMLAGLAAELAARRPRLSRGVAAAIVLALLACLPLTYVQAGYWRDGRRLFTHALEVTENNFMAHQNLGIELEEEGKEAEAAEQFSRAVGAKADFAEGRRNLATQQYRAGRLEEAIKEYRTVIRLKPDMAEAHDNLAAALVKAGRLEEAVAEYRAAARLKPRVAEVHCELGRVLVSLNKLAEAETEYRKAIKLRPNFPEAHHLLGLVLAQTNRPAEALAEWREALRQKPDMAETRNNIGSLLASQGKLTEAMAEWQEALRLQPDNAAAGENLQRARAMLNAVPAPPSGR